MMSNSYFRFKQFIIRQEKAAFRVTTDSVLLGAWADLDGVTEALDIGTGTGLLALMTAQRCDAFIVAVEPDTESMAQAAENIRTSPWASRIELVESRIQDYSPEADKRFDTIITNPPFFSGSLPNPDARKANARHTLSLGTRELLEAANRTLKPGGTLQLVLPVTEASGFIDEAARYGFSCVRMLHVSPDKNSSPVRVLMTMGYGAHNCREEILAIETGERHSYSDEYVALTRDFYLYM